MSDSSRSAAAARMDRNLSSVFERVRRRRTVADVEFDAIYPEWIETSEHHWTPLDVCVRAAELLVAGGGATVLDVGSGAGGSV